MFSLDTHTHTHTHMVTEVLDVLINLTVVIILHCMHISNHYIVYLKYMQCFDNYNLIKLEKKKIIFPHLPLSLFYI